MTIPTLSACDFLKPDLFSVQMPPLVRIDKTYLVSGNMESILINQYKAHISWRKEIGYFCISPKKGIFQRYPIEVIILNSIPQQELILNGGFCTSPQKGSIQIFVNID